jgi:hypothetical protein
MSDGATKGAEGDRSCPSWGEDPSDDGFWGQFDSVRVGLEVWPPFELKSGFAGVRVRRLPSCACHYKVKVLRPAVKP